MTPRSTERLQALEAAAKFYESLSEGQMGRMEMYINKTFGNYSMTYDEVKASVQEVVDFIAERNASADLFLEIPDIFKTFNNWVTFKSATEKAPIKSGTFDNAKSNDPATWVDYSTLVTNIRKGVGYPNPGFVPDGPRTAFLTAIDIDNCRNKPTGEIKEWAQRILKLLGATYAEVTVSGTGIRAWVIIKRELHTDFKLGEAAKANDGKEAQIEVVNDKQYMTISRAVLAESVNHVRELSTAEADAFFQLMADLQREFPSAAQNESQDIPLSPAGKVPHGYIHKWMLTQAGKLRRMGFSIEALEVALLDLVHHQCDPPIDDSKVIQCARSFEKYERGRVTDVMLSGQQAVLVGGAMPEVRDVVELEVQQAAFTLPIMAMTSTRLGDIWATIFEPNGWPMGMALPSLVTAASVIVPRMPRPDDGSILLRDDPMTTLYTAQIAPVHCGKTQVNEWGAKALGIWRESRGPGYYAVKTGSTEQLFKNLSKHAQILGQSVLINPDEWSHLLSKAGIKDASFPKILTSMFYSRQNTITVGGVGGGKEIFLDMAVSFTGGIVQDDFGTVFSAETLGGLYDRFLFGLAPEGFKWDYVPYPKPIVPFDLIGWAPVSVTVDPSVFEVTKHWNKLHPEWGRIVEVCTRVATIFASVDGRRVVTGKDLEALESLARYQMYIRSMFRPNAGTNPDAQFANAAEDWVNANASQWRAIRDLKKGVHNYEAKLGPNVAERSLLGLAKADRIELWLDSNGSNPLPSDYDNKGRRPKGLVRKVRHV
jgi:hypothetical protein